MYALLVWSLVWGTGGLARLLGTRNLVVLGEASYAPYLLHGPIHHFFQILEPSRIARVAPLLSFCLCAAVSVAASIIVFFRFEEPARRWPRQGVTAPRLAKRRVGSPSAG